MASTLRLDPSLEENAGNRNGRQRPACPAKIAYVIGHLKTGGAQKHLYELLRRLDRSRFSPRVYCLKRSGALVRDIAGLGVGVEDLRIGSSFVRLDTGARLLRFARHLRQTKVSLLHCYLPRANFFGALAGRLANIPAVLISKRSLEPQDTVGQRFLCRVANLGAHALLANSDEVWRHARATAGCKPDKLRLVPNGIDIERYQKLGTAKDGDGPPVIGTVLRLETVKGPHVFLAAAAHIAAKNPDARFVIVGDGNLRSQIEQQRRSLGLEDRVELLGERDDIAEILAGFSVFVLPSFREGMSMALLEAMAAARPVVATRVGGNKNLIRHEENGLLVAPGNAEEIAGAVLRFLNDRKWAEGRGLAAQNLVAERYNADLMTRRIEGIYSELLYGEFDERSH